MDPSKRDDLARAPVADLRAAGFDILDGFADCANPGDLWQEVIQKRQAAERQRRAVAALGELTPDDVRALLEAIHGE